MNYEIETDELPCVFALFGALRAVCPPGEVDDARILALTAASYVKIRDTLGVGVDLPIGSHRVTVRMTKDRKMTVAMVQAEHD